MKKSPIYIYGAIIIIEGIILLFSKSYTFDMIKYSIGIALTFGAIVAFFEALSRFRKQVEFSYHEIHVLSMMVYGVSVLFFADTLESLKTFTLFLFIFYTFSEIAFCNWLFNLDRGVINKIVLIRVFLALLVGIGIIITMFYRGVNETLAIEGFGVLFIIIGINVLLYTPVMKPKELNQPRNDAQNVS